MSLPITHVEWQQQVVELAQVLGWRHLHVRRSIGKGKRWVTSTNVIGWPDLWLWHPSRGFVALELKVGKDRATEEQAAVLRSLAQAGARAAVVYPEELDFVQQLLSVREAYTTLRSVHGLVDA